MTEHKYTDDEIVKALECCRTIDGNDCSTCPYNGKRYEIGFSGCPNHLVNDALDLINRQKAEVAYWQDEAVNAKKEAVKEFAEIAKRRLPVISPIVFDGIAKEIVEDRDE